MSLALLLAAAEGHVRLNYMDGSDGSPRPIRNANSETGNGRASVAGGPPWFKTYCFQTHVASEVPYGGSLLSCDAGQGGLRP